MWHRLLPLLLAFAFAGPAKAEQPLHIFAAGSLTGAFTDIIAAFNAPQGAIAPPVFGPSGVLRQRIEKGEPVDVFASADMGNPQKLAAERPGLTVTPFVHNSLCVQGWQRLNLTQANLLDHMLDPNLILATSTPKADPGGDYAWAVFARADQVHPGARALLEAKARPLVGGPDSKLALPGHGAVAGLFLTHQADLFLGYCSNVSGLLADVPGLVSVPLAPPLAPQGADHPQYGMVVLGNTDMARRFAAFVLSPQGQAILAKYGFDPVTSP